MSYFDSLRDDHEEHDALALHGIPHGVFTARTSDPQSGFAHAKRMKFNNDSGDFVPNGEQKGTDANSNLAFMGTADGEAGYEQQGSQGRAYPYQRTRGAGRFNPSVAKGDSPKTGIDAYWKDNLPVLQELQYNKVNVQVAVLAPSTAPPDIKNQIHILNVKPSTTPERHGPTESEHWKTYSESPHRAP
jgi:hypothetical protein